MFDTVNQKQSWSKPAHVNSTHQPPPLHAADAEDELIAILHRIDQLEAQAARALAGVNQAARWRRRGYTSATAFLKHRAGMAGGRAMRLVARSNSLTAMPLTATAFERGDLGIDQVDVLCDAYDFNEDAYLAEEETLVSIAVQLPFVRELARLIEYWKQRIDPALVELDQDMLDSLRGIRLRREGGVGRAYICLSEPEFDVLLNRLDPGPPAPEDTRSLAQRRADRLMELTTTSMDRPQLLVHVDLERLNATHLPLTTPSSARRPCVAETEHGTVLPLAAVARIACDASVCRILFGPESQVLDVGRQRRSFTEPQRRAIIARDRHCRFLGCDRPPQWCDIHHIKHWLRGGRTCVENGVLLCRFHHTLVHEAGWSLTGTPYQLVIHDDLGRMHGSSCLPTSRARAP